MRNSFWDICKYFDKRPGPLVMLFVCFFNYIVVKSTVGINFFTFLSLYCFLFSFLAFMFVHEKDLILFRLLRFKVYKISIKDRTDPLQIMKELSKKFDDLGVKYSYNIDYNVRTLNISFQTVEDFNLIKLTVDCKKFDISPSKLF